MGSLLRSGKDSQSAMPGALVLGCASVWECALQLGLEWESGQVV